MKKNLVTVDEMKITEFLFNAFQSTLQMTLEVYRGRLL